MIVLLSPAKSLNEDATFEDLGEPTRIRFERSTRDLVARLREFSPSGLQELMGVSQAIAERDAERFSRFPGELSEQTGLPAVRMFAGDVYTGLAEATWTPTQRQAATRCLRILSGLYGVLRPYDVVAPYRLEMGTRLQVSSMMGLYEFWGSRLSQALAVDLEDSAGPSVVVNLASAEYARAAKLADLSCDVITPRFEDQTAKGSYRVISFHAKKARGMMARWLLADPHRVEAPDQFALAGYRFAPDLSSPETPVYRRPRDHNLSG